MGWVSEDLQDDHEGWPVAHVRTSTAAECFRELGNLDDQVDVEPLEWIAAGCQCGWRSPRFRPRPWWHEHRSDGTRTVRPHYLPHVVVVSDEDVRQVHALWRAHCEEVRGHGTIAALQAERDQARARAHDLSNEVMGLRMALDEVLDLAQAARRTTTQTPHPDAAEARR